MTLLARRDSLTQGMDMKLVYSEDHEKHKMGKDLELSEAWETVVAP